MFEAGPRPHPSSRPDESRNLARQRVAPPSTPRKSWAFAKEPPKKFLNASRQVVSHAPKTNTRGIYLVFAMSVSPRLETDGAGRHDAGGSMMSDEALFAEAILESYRRAIASVAAASGDIPAAALCLAAIWRGGGRLIYAGAGSSGLAAAEVAAELPGTFGLDASRIAIILSGGTAEPFRIDGPAEDDAAGEQTMVELGD